MWEKVLLGNANELFASPFVAKLRTHVDHIEDFFREPFELGSDFVLQHSRRNANFAPSQLKLDIENPTMLQYVEGMPLLYLCLSNKNLSPRFPSLVFSLHYLIPISSNILQNSSGRQSGQLMQPLF